jgi:hypothetical protein
VVATTTGCGRRSAGSGGERLASTQQHGTMLYCGGRWLGAGWWRFCDNDKFGGVESKIGGADDVCLSNGPQDDLVGKFNMARDADTLNRLLVDYSIGLQIMSANY